MTATSSPSVLAGWLLGPPGRQRVRASQALLAFAVYATFAVFQHAEVLLGLIDRFESNLLTAYNLAAATGFYVVIRSGLNLRFAADPSLTLAQCSSALVSVTWSYAITGPARGAVMSIMILVILFGLFQLSPRQARGLAIAAFALLGATMLWRATTLPARYDPRVEFIHFVFGAIVMTSIAVLSARLGRLRAHLSSQKAELANALERNRELAARDVLTGLLNRRAMLDILEAEKARQHHAGAPIALALIDIDWFKRINDTYGHHTGDAVLQRFADLSLIGLRAGDAMARWGGEEFLLMMPGTARDGAHDALARLRLRVAEAGFERMGEGLAVSFSAGVAECASHEPYAAAIERADRALYRAKHAGRNRVESG